ncbi:MAG: peptide chain release factor N(5)-glutamine methyltransferase [Lachnospiraceae bacterium]|nr:peptide chain release factor N(5)-glutamine methyltransferase [Lachnospiraceae bacterium]
MNNEALTDCTLGEIYRHGARLLREANIEDYSYDALCLMEHFFSVDRAGLILHGDRAAEPESRADFFSAIQQRLQGRPLQYIIGIWSFMDFDFYIGEGVLIPREDTETAVNSAVDYLKSLNIARPRVIDLCSGSGAIAIAIAKLVPQCEVTAVELSDKAAEYLHRNVILNSADNVTLLRGDVEVLYNEFSDEEFDLIISNPPYIETNVIDTLQQELKYEPRMALDGGRDGLYFYRIITELWHSKLKHGGMLVYEIGENQYKSVSELLKRYGFGNIFYKLDVQNIKRAVGGIRL